MNQDIINSKLAALDPTDSELVLKAQEGDLEAFSLLYKRFLPQVHKRVWFVVPPQDVDDVIQEVFIATMRSLRSFRGEAKFSTWLRVITNRQIANYYRKRNKHDHETEFKPDDTDLSNALHAKDKKNTRTFYDDRIMLKEILSELPDHYRNILILRFAEGLKFQEIANIEGKSLDAIKSLFRRALQAMRDAIAKGDQHVI